MRSTNGCGKSSRGKKGMVNMLDSPMPTEKLLLKSYAEPRRACRKTLKDPSHVSKEGSCPKTGPPSRPLLKSFSRSEIARQTGFSEAGKPATPSFREADFTGLGLISVFRFVQTVIYCLTGG